MPESSPLRWRKTDESLVLAHCPDHCEQFLYYARSYTVGRGYDFSQTNQLILNLKIAPGAQPQRLHYKQQAIRQFAQEGVALLKGQLSAGRVLTLVPIPPSKDRSHPDYDDRLEQVAAMIAEQVPQVAWLPLLSTHTSVESYHSRSDRRNPDEIYELMQVDPIAADRAATGSIVALLDDVLTSGAHFTAARRHILETWPGADVIGLFWAKAVSPDDFF